MDKSNNSNGNTNALNSGRNPRSTFISRRSSARLPESPSSNSIIPLNLSSSNLNNINTASNQGVAASSSNYFNVTTDDLYGVNTQASSSQTENQGAITKKLFMFVQSLKLEKPLHPLMCLSIHMLIAYQTLSLGVSLDYNWGEYGRYIYNILLIPRTLGFQYLPYEGFIALAVIVFVIQSLCFLIIYITYRSIILGSSYWKKIRTAGRFVFFVMTFLSLPITFGLMQGFFDCDFTSQVSIVQGAPPTYALRSFRNVECWGTMNGILASISLIFCIIQILITMSTVMIFCDTIVSSKAKFVLENPFVMSYLIGTNQLYLIVAGVTPHVLSYLRPVYYIVFSLGFIVLMFGDLPFLIRRANSVYGGIGFARIGVGISSLVSSLINKEDMWEFGLGLTFSPFVLGVIFFLIGFVIVEMYSKSVKKRGFRLAQAIVNCGSDVLLTQRELPYLSTFIKFSLKGTEEDKKLASDLIRIIHKSEILDAKAFILIAMVYKEMPNYFLALLVIKKAEKKRANMFTQYSLYIRTKELEKNLSGGRTTSGASDIIMEGTKRRMKTLKMLIIQFWKNVLASVDVDSIIQQIQRLSNECDLAFHNLLIDNEEDVAIQKLFAQYQEEFKLGHHSSSNNTNTDNDRSDKAPGELIITKSYASSSMRVDMFGENVNDEAFDSVSVSELQQTEDDQADKQQEVFSTALHKKDVNSTTFYFIVGSGLVSIVLIAILLIVGLSFTQNDSVFNILMKSAKLSSIPTSALCGVSNMNGKIGTISTLNWSSMADYRKSFQSVLEEDLDKIEVFEDIVDSTSFNELVSLFYLKQDKILKLEEQVSKNTSTSWFVKKMKRVLSETIISTNSSKENDPDLLEFMAMNRLRFADGIADFFQNTLNFQKVELSNYTYAYIGLSSFIGLVFILYLIFNSFCSFKFLHQRKQILNLFKKIPKDDSKRVIVGMEKSLEKDGVNIDFSKNGLSSNTYLVIVVLLSFIVATATMSFIIADIFRKLNILGHGLYKMESTAEVMHVSQNLRYGLLQVASTGDYEQRLKFHDRLLMDMNLFDIGWNNLRFGSQIDSYFSLSGFNANIDNVLTVVPFNCSHFDCRSLDTQIGQFRTNILNFNQMLTSNQTIYLELNQMIELAELLFDHSLVLLSNLETLNKLCYYHFFQDQPLLTILSSVLGCPLLLILTWITYTYTSTIENENYVLRKLFNYIPWEVLDTNDDIRNYIFFHILSTGRMRSKNKFKTTKERAILEAALTSAVICSSSGTIDIFNNASEKLFGFRGDQIIGFPLHKLFDKESSAILDPVISKMGVSATSYSETLELTGLRKNSSSFPVELRISVSALEGRNIISCFMRDISEHKIQVKELAEEKKKSESLLMNIMPESVAQRLIAGETLIADKFDDVTILFCDIVGLLDLNLSAYDLVQTLNEIIHEFDDLTINFNLEKIKTIGSKYFCTAGLKPDGPNEAHHVERTFAFAVKLSEVVELFCEERGFNIGIRVGINSGPIVAGVCGVLKYAYDVWSDAVNTASRMESTCPSGFIQVTETCYQRLKDKHGFQERFVEVKGKGQMRTYIHHPNVSEDLRESTLEVFRGTRSESVIRMSLDNLRMSSQQLEKHAVPPLNITSSSDDN